MRMPIRKMTDFKVTLEFKSKEDREDWLGWYLDGGGEQDAGFYAKFDRRSKASWKENPPRLILEKESKDD